MSSIARRCKQGAMANAAPHKSLDAGPCVTIVKVSPPGARVQGLSLELQGRTGVFKRIRELNLMGLLVPKTGVGVALGWKSHVK